MVNRPGGSSVTWKVEEVGSPRKNGAGHDTKEVVYWPFGRMKR